MADNKNESKRAILVTGATGKQGGATIDALVARGALNDYTLLAVTRDPKSAAAGKLESRGITLVQGDLNDCPTLFKNAKTILGGGKNAQIWAVFSVQVLSEKEEEKQGKALIDAALANQVDFFVYSSVDRGGEIRSPTNPTNVPHFVSKHNIEKHLLAATKSTTKNKTDGMKWTILRPVAFMDNLMPGFGTKFIATGWRMLLGEKPIQLIATKDIGFFAAEALMRPDEFAGRSMSLASDELTYKQIDDIFKANLGHGLPLTFPWVVRLIMWLSKEVGNMMRWFAAEGYGANITAVRAEHPKILSLGDWLKQSPWVE
ncbi:hypothetical protein J3E68DRAFT_429876 [Trichoderma sp. SZMC 28012]